MNSLGESLDHADFTMKRRKWMTSRPPIGGREAPLWLVDCTDVFGQLPYLTLTRAQPGEKSLHMIELAGAINLPVEEWHYVRADFETLWAEDVAQGLKTVYCSFLKESVFVFEFVCMTNRGEYVTGRFHGRMIR